MFTDAGGELITTSKWPGTTLDLINIEFGDNKFIVDTPGIINEHQYAHYVDDKTLSKILPKKEIRQRVYQLEDKQTLFIEKLATISHTLGDRKAFNCYFANEVEIHRTKYENKEKIWANDTVGKLKFEETELWTHKFNLGTDQTDIVISGLGWVRVSGKGLIEVEAPKGVKVIKREALI
jgi:ribosome biogenesis GTPase A